MRGQGKRPPPDNPEGVECEYEFLPSSLFLYAAQVLRLPLLLSCNWQAVQVRPATEFTGQALLQVKPLTGQALSLR